MSDSFPAPDPAEAAEPVAPVAPEVVEPAPLHPAWEKALEPIPDMLRTGIVDQIRTSDREAQKAIEAARGTIDPEWQKFLTSAQAAGATPSDLVAGWNTAQAIKTDPIGFSTDLNDNIDKLVKAGVLTRPEGAAAKVEAANAAAAQDSADDSLLTPEGKKLIEMQQRIEELSGTVQQDLSAREQAQQNQQAQAYGDAFFAEIDNQFNNGGLGGASNSTKVAVARYADSLLDADPTGTLTEAKAIEAAIVKMREAAGELTPKPAAPAALPLPVGGGSSSMPSTMPTKFETEAARSAAMIAEAQRVLALE